MRSLLQYVEKNKWPYIFLIPWVMLFSVFYIYPAISGIVISFYDFDFVKKTYAGISNFITLFKDPLFIGSIINTCKFAILLVPSTVIFSFLASIVITRLKRGNQSVFKIIFFAPAITSTVAMSIVWKWMYNPAYGALLNVTDFLGTGPVDWLGKPFNALISVSIIIFMYSVGQPIILYSAAIMNIPQTYYEAASLDGAGKLQVIRNVTIPLTKPTSLYILLINTINTFQIFEFILLITAGGPSNSTSTILHKMYLYAFSYSEFGLATAMSVILSGIILVIAIVQFRLIKSDIEY